MKDTRTIKAPTGTELQAKSWLTEAPLRMIMMKRYSCNPANRSAYFAPTKMRREY